MRRRRATPLLVPAFVVIMAVHAAWLVPALAGAAAALTGLRLLRRREQVDGRPGRWRRVPRPAPDPAGRGSVVIGRDGAGNPVALDPAQLAAHGLVLGASGAGKTTTLLRLLSERVADGLPVVALDLKGSPAFTRTLAAAAARAGRPFVCWSLDGPATWNPLAHGNPTELKDKLIATERFTEPHYQRAAERYLLCVLRVLAAGGRGAPTLADVVALSDPRRLEACARRLAEPLRSEVRDYLSRLTRDQLSAIHGLGTRLALITESHTGRYLAPAGPDAAAIDLRSALRGDAVVVFSLNASTYGKLAAQIGTIVVQDLVGAAGARQSAGAQSAAVPALVDAAGARLSAGAQRGADPALVGIDEFSALGADQILSLFARGREAGVSVVLATQELADLDRVATGLRDQIIGNTTVKVIHRQDVPGSARLAAQLAGTRWVWEQTHHFGPTASLWQAFVPRGSRRRVERFRVAPDTIASLPTGRALLITKAPVRSVRMIAVRPPEVGIPSGDRAPGSTAWRRWRRAPTRNAAPASRVPARDPSVPVPRPRGREGPER